MGCRCEVCRDVDMFPLADAGGRDWFTVVWWLLVVALSAVFWAVVWWAIRHAT